MPIGRGVQLHLRHLSGPDAGGTDVLRRPARVGAVELRRAGPYWYAETADGRRRLRPGDRLDLGGGAVAEVSFVRDPVTAAAGLAATVLLLSVVVGGALMAHRTRRAAPAANLEARLARERRVAQARLDAQRREYEARLDRFRGEMADLEGRLADRADLERRVGAVRRAVANVESTVLDRVESEVERRLRQRPELEQARAAVQRMRRSDQAAEELIRRYGGSVCLIQGAYGFGRKSEKTGAWRFLREAPREMLRELDLSGEKVPLTLEGEGEVFSVEYTGTGFLVDRAGVVLTNRHIAQPWWRNDAARPLLGDGYEARFLFLRAYFPGAERPVEFELDRTRVSADADLAALRFEPPEDRTLPPALPLAGDTEAAPGRRVLLLGYPSGLDALLARSGDDFADRLAREGQTSPTEVLDALAAGDLVRALPSLGHVADVLGDKILFDAATAVGGSGGPLLDMEGRVVAVNYGILKAFRGANFAVPVRYARELLGR